MFSALKHPVTNPGPLVLWPIPLNNSCILWAWGQNSPCLRLVFRKQVTVGVEAWYQRLWQQAQRAPKIHRTHYISLICTNLAELASTRLSKICPTSELKYPSTRIKVSSTSLLGGSVSQDGREQFHIFFWVVFSGIYIYFFSFCGCKSQILLPNHLHRERFCDFVPFCKKLYLLSLGCLQETRIKMNMISLLSNTMTKKSLRSSNKTVQ